MVALLSILSSQAAVMLVGYDGHIIGVNQIAYTNFGIHPALCLGQGERSRSVHVHNLIAQL